MPEGVSIGGLSGTISVQDEFSDVFNAFGKGVDQVIHSAEEAGQAINAFGKEVDYAAKAFADENEKALTQLMDRVRNTQYGFEELKTRVTTNLQGIIPALEGFKDGVENAIAHPLEFAKGAALGFIEVLGPVGIAITAVAGIAAIAGKELWDLGEAAAKAGGNINDMSEKMSLSTDRTSKLKFAFDVAGGSIQQASNLIFMMQRRMSDSPDAFEKGLGKIKLSISDLEDLKPDEQIYKISRAFQENTDQTNRSSTAMALFSRQGREAIPILMKDLTGLAEQSSDLAVIWSEEDAKAAEEFEMASRKLSIQFESLAISVGKELIPVMTKVVELASDGVKGFESWAVGTVVLAAAQLNLLGPLTSILKMLQAPPEPPKDIQLKVPEVNAATQKSIEATEKLWSEYYEVIDKAAGDSTAVQIEKTNQWYAAQQKTLDKSAATNKNYGEQQIALNNAYWVKLEHAGDSARKTIEGANAAMSAKIQGLLADAAQNTAKLNEDTLGTRMAALDKWYTSEYAGIMKSKASWTEKTSAIAALDADMWSKMQVAEKEFFDKEAEALATRVQEFEKTGQAAAAAVAKGLGGGQNVLKELAQSSAQFVQSVSTEVVRGGELISSGLSGASRSASQVSSDFQMLITQAPEVVHGGELISSNMQGYARTASLAADSVENLAGENQKIVGGAPLMSHALKSMAQDVGLVGATYDKTTRSFKDATTIVNTAIADMMTRAAKNIMGPDAQTVQWVKDLHDAGATIEEIAAILKSAGIDVTFNQITKAIGFTRAEFHQMLDSWASTLTQMAQVSGGTFGGIVKDIAQIVVAWNGAAKAAEAYTKAQEQGSRVGEALSLAQGATAVIGATGQGSTASRTAGGALSGAEVGFAVGGPLGAGIGAVIGGLTGLFRGLFGQISQLELKGRELETTFQNQFTSFSDMVNKIGAAYTTTGKTLQQARVDVKDLLDAEAKGPAAVQAIIDKLQESLNRAKEIDSAISGLGVKSHDELTHAADIANAAYEKIAAGVAAGQYTAEQATIAYRAYQQALADAGDTAAKAWLEATSGITDFAKAAEAAGYQTHEALQKAADDAFKLAQYMRDSGKYSAEAIKSAFDAADQAQMKALGVSQKILDQRKSLMDSISQEAPEAETGTIEKQQRAQLDAINKQLGMATDAQDAAAKAAEDAAFKAQHSWIDHIRTATTAVTDDFQATADATETNFNSAATSMHDSFVSAASDAADKVSHAFDGIEIRIPILFDQQQPTLLGGKSEAFGEVGFAPGPMTFSTQGNEFFAFGGEGQGAAGLTSKIGGRGSGPYTFQINVGSKRVKDVLIDELETAPTSRDVKVLKGLTK